MRAGLLSDPRVVVLLRRAFVPCMISARNTPECLDDPRDLETLVGCASAGGDDFDGGEREAFILPDGTMQSVFLSLHGRVPDDGTTHFTCAGRRTEDAVIPFRQHAIAALEQAHGELPEDWDAIWAGDDPEVAEIAEAEPRWPVPAPGACALRVFARNSYRMYEDLSGCELVAIGSDVERTLCAALREEGDAIELPEPAFRDLVRAMVPRGQVDTRLADDSIEGRLELRVERAAADVVRGTVKGGFAMTPFERAEVGKRDNAACLFRSSGRIEGRFVIDASTQRITELRAATTDVDLEWLPRFGVRAGEFAPRLAAAFEW